MYDCRSDDEDELTTTNATAKKRMSGVPSLRPIEANKNQQREALFKQLSQTDISKPEEAVQAQAFELTDDEAESCEELLPEQPAPGRSALKACLVVCAVLFAVAGGEREASAADVWYTCHVISAGVSGTNTLIYLQGLSPTTFSPTWFRAPVGMENQALAVSMAAVANSKKVSAKIDLGNSVYLKGITLNTN